MIETQEEHSEKIEYTFGRWITPKKGEPFLWIAPSRERTYEEAQRMAKVFGKEFNEDNHVYQIRTCTVISRLEEESPSE